MRRMVLLLCVALTSCASLPPLPKMPWRGAEYRRAMMQYCEFLTPTLVTPQRGQDAWKCEAAVRDYNRHFQTTLIFVEKPEAT